MRLRIVCVVAIVTLLAILATGCSPKSSGSSPADGDTSQQVTAAPTKASKSAAKATEAPSATPAPTAEPTVAEAVAEEIMFSDVSDLSKLNSYRIKSIIKWEEVDGDKGTMELTLEFTRDPAAQRIVFSSKDMSDGQSGTMEMISIEDTTYLKADEEWIAVRSTENPTEEIGQVWTPDDFLAGGDARLVGKETVNGLETRHYRYSDSAFIPTAGLTAVDKAIGDVWISTKYNVYVKAILHIEGHDEDGVKGVFDMESNLTDINTPITISAPEGVAKPGLPEDIPLMDGATEVSAFGQMVSFSIAKQPDEVAAFYKKQMQASGWTMEESIIETMLSFTKDNRQATVMISQKEEGSDISDVVVMVEEQAEQ